jgi:O-antigen/teichoic acid export membrane protein
VTPSDHVQPVDAQTGDAQNADGGLPLTNFLSLVTGEIGARSIAFVVTAVLARRLGAAAFGDIAFATAMTGYLLLVPNLALQDLASRAVARAPHHARGIIASVTRVRMCVAVAGAVLVVVLASLLPVSRSVTVLMALCCLVALPQAVNVAWAHKALEQPRLVGTSLMLAQAAALIAVLLGVRSDMDVFRVPVIQAIGEVAAAAVLLPLLLSSWREGTFARGVVELHGAGTVILNRLLRGAIVTADVVLLGFMVSPRSVGLYSAAYRVCFLLTAIAASAHVVFQPALMRASESPAQAARVLTDALWMAWAVGLPLVVGGILVASDLLSLLFGDAFRDGTTAFRILLVSIGLLFIHGALYGAYMARHRLGLQTVVLAVAVVVNLALNAMLIPSHGIVGSAIATAAAEAVILVCSATVLWRWHWRPDLRPLLKPAAAVLGMAAVLYVLPASWPVLLRITLSATVYAVLLIAIGGLPPQITQMLKRGRVPR